MAIFGVKLPRIYNPWFVALIATLGGALFGFDISSMSAIIGTDQYRDYFNNPAGVVQGGINSALAAGSVLGSLFAGPLSNYIGRRNSIAVACVPWMIGTALQAAVNGVGMLIAGRVLNGVTVGITSSQVPVYLAEIAKREKRGSLIIIQQLAIGTKHPDFSSNDLDRLTISRRMGYSHNVFHRVRLLIYRRSSLFPHCLVDAIHSLPLSHHRPSVSSGVPTLVGDERSQ